MINLSDNFKFIDLNCYQANPDFKPDKRNLWKIPPKKTGWVLAHNAIRGEISSFEKTLINIKNPLQKSQIESIKIWWNGHFIHVHEHHSNEDNVFNPFLRTRINYPDKLESDHVQLVEHLNKIDSCIKTISQNDAINELLDLWIQYKEMMFPHLLEEEKIGLPLVMAYFTPEEVSEVTAEFAKKGDKCAIGSFIHWMETKENCMEFMENEGIPWIVWYLPCCGFKSHRDHYRSVMIKSIENINKNSI